MEALKAMNEKYSSYSRNELIEEISRYATLIDNIKLLNSSHSLDEVLDVVLTQACNLLSSQTASILLYDENEKCLTFAASTDPDIENLKKLKVPADQGIAGHVFQTGEIINIEDIRKDERYYKAVDENLERTTQAYLCVPLVLSGKNIGTAQIMDKNDGGIYTQKDGELLLAFGAQSAAAIERARFFEEMLQKEIIEKENMRMRTELDVAREIQTMLLPAEDELALFTDVDIALRMDTASEVGGDFLEILPGPEGSLYFAIGDVTDHGLQSGLITLMAQSSFRTLVENLDLSLSDMLMYINSVLFGNLQNRMNNSLNLTLMIGKYADGKLTIAGQHESILILRKNNTVEVVSTEELGIYIGLIEDVHDYLGEKSIVLEKGDSIIFFTDGITENENPQGQQFGTENLATTIQKTKTAHPREMIDAIYNDLYSWIDTAQVYDDMTIMILRKT